VSEAERPAQALYTERLSWPEAQEALRRHYRATGNEPEYARSTTVLADAFPFAATLQFEAAAALVEIGRSADGWRYAERAIALEPRTLNHLLVGAHALLSSGRRDEGRALLERVLRIDPGNATARRVLQDLASTP
jgi:tetratricopeptide (TPR) repeat protein